MILMWRRPGYRRRYAHRDQSQSRDCPGRVGVSSLVVAASPESRWLDDWHAAMLRKYDGSMWIEWNLEKIAAHALSAEEVEAAYN